MKLIVTLTIALAITSSAAAKPSCPASTHKPPYPWLVDQLMDGDEYADVYIDVDHSGKPVSCRIGQSNIEGDDKFFVCKAFLEQWSTAPTTDNPTIGPPPPNLPSHSVIKGTVYRKYVAYGDRHEKAERAARKKYFQEHPEERPECYPNDD